MHNRDLACLCACQTSCHVCVGPGCSWRDLPGVDPSNDASAKSSLVLAAVRRFLTLRQEVGGWVGWVRCGEPGTSRPRSPPPHFELLCRCGTRSSSPSCRVLPDMTVPLPYRIVPAQYPSDDLPTYEMSSNHLRGRDAWLVERVTRELSTAYSQLFSDVKWDTKQFQTYWCSRQACAAGTR
jgi:hypothetical protein